MKKLLFLTTLILNSSFLIHNCLAQAPSGFTYQSVLRDANSDLILNTSVGTQISILQGSSSGTAVYVETHSASTNANGLLTLQVGSGSVQSGTFSSIDWSNGPYFIKTETDPAGGTSYTITGTQQMMSVPYALYAAEAGSSTSSSDTMDIIAKDGGTAYIKVRDTSNVDLIEFTVGGVEKMRLKPSGFGIGTESPVYTLDLVGSFRFSDGNQTDGYVLTSDSYGEARWTDPLSITTDTPTIISDADSDTKIQVEESSDEDMIRFDVGGTEVMSVVKNANGYATFKTASSSGSLHIGNEAGIASTTATNNVFIGNNTATLNTTGSGNSVVGYNSFYQNTTGFANTVMGNQAGSHNQSGSYNTFIGTNSGSSNVSGQRNVYVGNGSGGSATGSRNISIGFEAGQYSTSDYNVFLGYQAGNQTTGGSNVFLGYQAGKDDTGSNRLYIENSSAGSSDALIYGEFDNDWVRIGGYLTPEGGIADSDNDTKIQVEESADEDIIRFDLAGTEFYRMDNGRLEVLNTEGSIYIGENAGAVDAFENANVFIGSSAGSMNTTGSYNLAVGQDAFASNTQGGSNVAIGASALFSNTDGSGNLAIGESAMYENGSGSENVAIGAYTLADNSSGGNNLALGNSALRNNTTGTENTAIGDRAGYNNVSGDGNVFIGSRAGYNETGSDKLYIDNSNTSSPLIYGEFDSDLVRINGELDVEGNIHTSGNYISNDGDDEGIYVDSNGNVGIGTTTISDLLHVSGSGGIRLRAESTGANYAGLLAKNSNRNIFIGVQGAGDPNPGEFHIYDNTASARRMVITAGGNVGFGYNNPSYKLQVNGQVAGTSAYVNTSDGKYKTNVQPIGSALEKLLLLQGVSYDWKTEEFPEKNFDARKQLGFIAQEVEPIVPEAVSITKEGDYGLSYSTFIPLLVEAIKELKAENEALKAELTAEKTSTSARLERLEELMGVGTTVSK